MGSKAHLQVLIAVIGLAAASALATDAIEHGLWANLIAGGLILAACAAVLIRARPQALQDPPPNPPRSTVTDPLTVLVDQVPIPLLRYSQAQGLQAVNRAARGLFRMDDVIADPPPPLLGAIVGTEPGAPASVVVFGRTYAVGISEIVAPDSTVRLVSLTDIQSEVRMAEATALRDLLRVLSHEIMNSLTPVGNLAGIARDYLETETSPGSRSAREALDVLAQRASGLTRFVEAYRSMARLPEPLPRPSDIAGLVRDVVRVFEQSDAGRTVAIELDLMQDCPSLDVDETLLTQALLNVLTNAAEATTPETEQGRVRISLSHDRNEVRIVVSDNGSGVADSLAGQIFHAFVTTKASGTGTGLNLARQIALAHGGDLVFLGRNGAWSAEFALILRVTPRSSL